MHEADNVQDAGWLSVSGGHRLYYEDWGNPNAKTPIIFLHGGPGAGNSAKNYLFFDPTRQRVIFFDQRGAGKSKPFANTRHNTTQDLVQDITRLREHLKIGNVQLAGGSWGSTLALCYAIAHPKLVERMLLWSIFLGRQQDLDFLNQGGGHIHFPDAWKRYIDMVPELARRDTIAYYAKQFEHRDPAVRQHYIKEWVLFENSLMNLDAQPEKAALDADAYDETALALAKLETHYFLHKCFLTPNYILKNAPKLHHIPTILVQGRYDFVCPPSGALALQQAIGDQAKLHMVMSGHSRSDPVLREVVKAYASAFLSEHF